MNAKGSSRTTMLLTLVGTLIAIALVSTWYFGGIPQGEGTRESNPHAANDDLPNKSPDKPKPKPKADPELTQRLIATGKAEKPDEVATILLDSEINDTSRNEAANLLRRSGDKDLTPRLIRALGDPKNSARFRSFCVQHLWMNLKGAKAAERGRIIAVLHGALEDKEVRVRREALLALVREKDARGCAAAVAWLTSPEAEDVRDLAIRCVKELELKEHIPEIRKHLEAKNESTRIAAIVALSQWGDEASRPAFELAAKSRVLRISRAGEAALKRMDMRKN